MRGYPFNNVKESPYKSCKWRALQVTISIKLSNLASQVLEQYCLLPDVMQYKIMPKTLLAKYLTQV